MALGAGGSNVVALVLKEGLLLAGIGVALGLGGAALLTRLMSSLLVGIAPRDPVAFGAAAAILLAVAALACYVPARRAVRVNPITALRSE
jgi:ABC-type antimicrobial peptide transport system permease subunit